MTKHIALLSTLAVSLLASFAVQAADTTELKVKGTIRPAACTPSFAGGDVVDYGVIMVNKLKAGVKTVLPVKSIDFRVACDGPIKIAMTVIDNRAGSIPSGVATEYGLGTINGTKIGGYSIVMGLATTDGAAATPAMSKDKTTWGNVNKMFDNILPSTFYTWYKNSSFVTTQAFSTLKLTVTVQATLDKPENLPLTQDIPLDGSATFQIEYL